MQDTSLEIKHLLAGSPLRDRRTAMLAGILFVALLGFGAYNLLWPFYGGSPRMIEAFVIGALIAMIASGPAILFVWYLDRREHESPLLLAGAALWGAAVSASISLAFSNTLYGYMLRLAKQSGGKIFGFSAETFTSVVTSPLIEEVVKGAAILILFWLLRSDLHDLRDGMLYGAMVGLGFNAAQYTIFLLNEFAISGTPPFLSLAALQFVFLGINGHFIYSALFGAGFGLARQTRNPTLKWLAPVSGVVLAIYANVMANTLGTKVINDLVRALTGNRLFFSETPPQIVWLATAAGTVASQLWAFVLLSIGVYQNEKWEVELIRKQLLSEVNTAVTPLEYALIAADAPFKVRDVPGYLPATAHAIMHAQNELAYRKWQVEQEGGKVEGDELVQAWRARVAQLRESAER
ncbi:MAG: PrsW family glutamic-type intramembrane protease [Chloroflexota bacterium]